MNERRVTRRASSDVYARDNTGFQRRRVSQAGLNRLVSRTVEDLDSRANEEDGSFFAFLTSRRSLEGSSRQGVAPDSRRSLTRRHHISPTPLPTGGSQIEGDNEMIQYKDEAQAGNVTSASQNQSTSDEEKEEEEKEEQEDQQEEQQDQQQEQKDEYKAKEDEEEAQAEEQKSSLPSSTASAGDSTVTVFPNSAPTSSSGGTIQPMDNMNPPKGLGSTPGKIGLVVGLTVGCALIVFFIVFLILRRRRGSKRLWSTFTQRPLHRTSPSGPVIGETSWPGTKDAGWDIPDELKRARDQATNQPSVKTDLESNLPNRPLSLTQRLLRGPLTSNPLSPISRNFFKRSSAARSSLGSEAQLERGALSPGAAAFVNRSHLSLRTDSTEQRESIANYDMDSFEKELYVDPLPPAKSRKQNTSFFSWSTSTAPSTPATTTRSNRDTVTTQDSEPPRYRSVTSWINIQSQRQIESRNKHPSSISYAAPPAIPEGNTVDRYPPTPAIPDTPVTPKTPRTPRTPGTPARGHRSTFQSFLDRHNRTISSTTVSTLPIFRQHPGEEVKIPRAQRIRSSSLKNATQWRL